MAVPGLTGTGGVITVETTSGAFVRLVVTNVDFTTPNGLGFSYEVLDAVSCGGPVDSTTTTTTAPTDSTVSTSTTVPPAVEGAGRTAAPGAAASVLAAVTFTG